jgi:hypothetical protein
MRLKAFAVLCTLTLALVVAAPAFPFDCTVAKKPATAGAVGIVDAEDNFTPLKNNPGTEEKPHGAFIAFTDGEFSASTFLHAPGGVLPPAREGGSQHNCDGKGLESLEVCFGG